MENIPEGTDLRMVKIAFPGDSLTTLFFKERTLHGFEGINVGAVSFHWTDKDEAKATGIPDHMLTDKHVMGSLTRIPDQSSIRTITSMTYLDALQFQRFKQLEK